MRVDASRNFARFGQVGDRSVEMREEPVAVHARMSIEAAIENRMKCASTAQMLRTAQRMVDLMRVFAAHMAKGDPSQTRGFADEHGTPQYTTNVLLTRSNDD